MILSYRMTVHEMFNQDRETIISSNGRAAIQETQHIWLAYLFVEDKNEYVCVGTLWSTKDRNEWLQGKEVESDIALL